MMSKAGVPYNNEYCLIYRLRDRKIVEMTEYQDSTLCERVLGPYPRADRAS
jgi:ketosteroid isomerase-like protein